MKLVFYISMIVTRVTLCYKHVFCRNIGIGCSKNVFVYNVSVGFLQCGAFSLLVF